MGEIANFSGIAIGAIIAALITGLVTFISLVISKENKVSEFRIEWINTLRDSVSQYCSCVSNFIESNFIHSPRIETKEYLQERQQNIIFHGEVQEKLFKLILLLNPNESNHTNLIGLVKDLMLLTKSELILSSKKPRRSEDLENLGADYIDLVGKITKTTQIILKSEWERVKEGEQAYSATKRLLSKIGLICLVIALILGGYLLGYQLYEIYQALCASPTSPFPHL